MNSAEFLALIEEHPLPWAVMYPEKVVVAGGEYRREPLLPLELVGALRLAAPAMAAAIIELLQYHDGSDGGAYTDAHINAIRASLPESLRP